MRPQTNSKSENLNHGDTPATPIASGTLLTETSNSNASNIEAFASTGAQHANSVDSTEAGSPSDQNNTPTVTCYPQRKFSCEKSLANGAKCTGSFNRKSDLTKHYNNYHKEPASTQAQTHIGIQPTSEPKGVTVAGVDSNAGCSSEPEITVNSQGTPDKSHPNFSRPRRTPKPRTATGPKGSGRKKRKTEKSLQSKVPGSLQAMTGADPAVAAEGFRGAMLGAQDHLNYGYHPDPNPFTGHGQEVFDFEAQSSLATDGPRGIKWTARMMSSHDTQAQAPFNQQPWVDPCAPPIPAGNFGQLRGPNNEFHGPMRCTDPPSWVQNNQDCYHPYGPQYAANARGQILPLGTFGPSSPGFTNDGHAQYQTPMLHQQVYQQQQDNFVNGGPGYNGYTQYQTLMPPPPPAQHQQKKSLGNDGSGALGYKYAQDWAQIPSQESTVDGDQYEFESHGFFPEYDHFEEGCLECKGRYCFSCRARFLEWFPTSDFRQFVEEVCKSESVEYYPPIVSA